MAPAPTPVAALLARQLAATSTPASSSLATTATPTDTWVGLSPTPTSGGTVNGSPNSFFGSASGSSIVHFVTGVAIASALGAFLLWRSGLPVSLRAFFWPCGLRVRKLGIDVKPVARRPIPPPRPAGTASTSRRNRRSRRTTTGPDIGAGGRRVSTGVVAGEGDHVDADGRSIAGVDEELPNYEADKLPTYASTWDPVTLSSRSNARSRGSDRRPASIASVTEIRHAETAETPPVRHGETTEALAMGDMMSDADYEIYIRNLNQPPTYQDEAITPLPPALRRGDTGL